MADACYGEGDAVSELLTASSKTTKKTTAISTPSEMGKNKIDKILDPLRTLEKQAQEHINDAKKTAEIAKQKLDYGSSVEHGSAGSKLNAAFADAQVKEYLKTLPTNEYAKMHSDVQGWFGGEFGTQGAMARQLEKAYKDARIEKIMQSLPNTKTGETIKEHLDELSGRGYLQDGDVTQFDIFDNRLDDIATIRQSDIFDTLDAGTRNLDTNDKIDIALRKIETDTTLRQELQRLGQGGEEIYESLTDAGKKQASIAHKTIVKAADKDKGLTYADVRSALDQLRIISEQEKELATMSETATQLKATIIREKLPTTQSIDRMLSQIESTPNMRDRGTLESIERDIEKNKILEPKRQEIRQNDFYEQYKNRLDLNTEEGITKASETLDNYTIKATKARTLLEADADDMRMSASMRGTLERGLQNPANIDDMVLNNAEKQITDISNDEVNILNAIKARDRDIPTSMKNTLTDQIEATKNGKKIDAQLVEKANRQADIIENYNFNDITADNIGEKLTELKKNLGDSEANEFMGRYFDEQLNKINNAVIPLTKRQNAIIDDITTSIKIEKPPIEKETVDELAEIVNKVNWSENRLLMEKMRVFGPLGYIDKQNIWKAMTKTGLRPTKSIWGITKFGVIGLPAYFMFAVFIEQNAFEAVFQFGSFGKEDDSAETLLSKYFGKDTIQKTFLAGHDFIKAIYNGMGAIPIYGEYFQAITMIMYSNVLAQDGNLEDIYNHLVERGLAIKLDTPDEKNGLLWRETTQLERNEIYKNDPKALFMNDASWVEKQLGNEKTGIFKRGKSGEELTKTKAMALYYANKGGYDISITKFGLTSDDLNDESMMIEVNKYGEKHDISETTIPSGSGATTTSGAYEKAIENAMKREGLTREQAIRNVDAEIKFMGDRDGMSREDALLKLTGVGGGSGSGGGSSSRSSESSYEYDEKKSETKKAMPSASQQQSLNQVKRGEKELSYEDVNALKVDGKVDIKTAKENGIAISDLAAKDKEATVEGFDAYAEQMKEDKKIDKSDWTQMKAEDKDAAREALRSAYGCGN